MYKNLKLENLCDVNLWFPHIALLLIPYDLFQYAIMIYILFDEEYVYPKSLCKIISIKTMNNEHKQENNAWPGIADG